MSKRTVMLSNDQLCQAIINYVAKHNLLNSRAANLLKVSISRPDTSGRPTVTIVAECPDE